MSHVKFYGDDFVRIWMRVKYVFYKIWIVMQTQEYNAPLVTILAQTNT